MFDAKKSMAHLDMLDKHRKKENKMSDLLDNLMQQQSQYNVQLKQAEINYQQLTGALHVLNDLIKVENARIEKEDADSKLQTDSNLVVDDSQGEDENGETVNQE